MKDHQEVAVLLDISAVEENKTNPKGRSEGKEFDDLVASIKEKGVLQPIIVRTMGKKFEVVAGMRRLAASKKAGLKQIPASVREYSDNEAREVQITENLQRAEVHPLDEAEAYRQLIEKSRYEIDVVASKVGKSADYVKRRLVLTNLTDKLAKAYREGKMNDGHASLIARLAEKDQLKAWEQAQRHWGVMAVKELKEWIDRNLYEPLENQPWTKWATNQAEMEKFVGKCVECQPNVATLFGNVKDGACTSYACWKRKMDAWVALMAKDHKAKRVSDEYGQPIKGLLAKSEYVKIGKKDRCESVAEAVVADGADIGKVIQVCHDPKCKTHRGGAAHYKRTPEEKATRKKQLEEAKKKEEKDQKAIEALLAKVKFPMNEKALDVLFDLIFDEAGPMKLQPIMRRRGMKPIVTKENGYSRRDYEKPMRELAEKGGKNGKLRMIFEILMWNERAEEVAKISKRL